jgi:ABC-2 type transport system ATP-binding protein
MWAVRGLDFTVGEGEIFGFLGPNGAGKTTTIRMLTGQLRPSEGRAFVAGCDVEKDRMALRASIGVVFEDQNLYERLTGSENLQVFADLYGTPRARVDELLKWVGLSQNRNRYIKEYSRGMKQRLLIARALLPAPKVLFLDEPTVGLDPACAREIRMSIREFSGRGITVFLTTHYIEEAQELCHRVAIINKGAIVEEGGPGQLREKYARGLIRVEFHKDGALTERLLHQGDPAEAALLADLVSAGCVVRLETLQPSLEEIFLELTGSDARQQAP